MSLYYLQTRTNYEFYCGASGNYQYISDKLEEKKCALDDSCEADSWIEAKQKFGFPLTSMQKTILETGFDYETMA